jgi:hypothetical protein
MILLNNHQVGNTPPNEQALTPYKRFITEVVRYGVINYNIIMT